MQDKTIFYLKLMRLLVAIGMILSIPIYLWMSPYVVLPSHESVMTLLLGLFTFLLGLEYKIKGKSMSLAYFMMLFAITMLIMVFLGWSL